MTAAEILKKVQTHKEVRWDSKTVRDAVATREQVVPPLLDHLNRYYEQIQNLKPDDDPDVDAFFATFNGYHLLGEMREARAYPVLLQFLPLPKDQLDLTFGLDLTEGLKEVLRNTYDGSLEATEALVANPQADEYARGTLLQAMGRICRDGRIPREELVRFMKEILQAEKQRENSGFIIGVMMTMQMLHLHELVLDLRDFVFCGVISDEEYADYLDTIFQYEDAPREEWVDTESEGETADGEPTPQEKRILNWMTGRNDPCPCGSGKKFKKCCLPKQNDLRMKYPNYHPDSMLQQILDRPQIIYPPIEDVGENPGLAAIFPREGIAVDEHAYRGMKIADSRPAFYQLTDREVRSATKQLWEAFEGFESLCQEHGFQIAADYDRAYAVHYCSLTWLKLLAELLEKSEDSRQAAVEKWIGNV